MQKVIRTGMALLYENIKRDMRVPPQFIRVCLPLTGIEGVIAVFLKF